MSLKAFHLVFLISSILLALGFGGWSIHQYLATGDALDLILGVVSLISGILLGVYGKYFLKKLKNIGYL
jgi:hypothetical protein